MCTYQESLELFVWTLACNLSISLSPFTCTVVLSFLDWALSPSAWLWQQVGFPLCVCACMGVWSVDQT